MADEKEVLRNRERLKALVSRKLKSNKWKKELIEMNELSFRLMVMDMYVELEQLKKTIKNNNGRQRKQVL